MPEQLRASEGAHKAGARIARERSGHEQRRHLPHLRIPPQACYGLRCVCRMNA